MTYMTDAVDLEPNTRTRGNMTLICTSYLIVSALNCIVKTLVTVSDIMTHFFKDNRNRCHANSPCSVDIAYQVVPFQQQSISKPFQLFSKQKINSFLNCYSRNLVDT